MTGEGSSLAEILAKEFGGIPEVRESVVALGVGATQIVQADPDRLCLIIALITVANIAFVSASAANALQGIPLNSTSPVFRASFADMLMLPTHEWFGSAAAASSVYVIEVRRSR
jgi:hypothetical protein